MIEPIFLMEIIVALLVLSMLAQVLTHYFQIPFIIFLFIEGIIVGPEVLNLFKPGSLLWCAKCYRFDLRVCDCL